MSACSSHTLVVASERSRPFSLACRVALRYSGFMFSGLAVESKEEKLPSEISPTGTVEI